eukprot:scaffold18199_cov160-Skeletonema_dohrnii-CCMP3373.AAC.1
MEIPEWASSGHPLRRCSDTDTTKKALARQIRYGDRVVLAAVSVSDASSGHLRRCSDADTTKKSLSRVKDTSILSWPTMMGH